MTRIQITLHISIYGPRHWTVKTRWSYINKFLTTWIIPTLILRETVNPNCSFHILLLSLSTRNMAATFITHLSLVHPKPSLSAKSLQNPSVSQLSKLSPSSSRTLSLPLSLSILYRVSQGCSFSGLLCRCLFFANQEKWGCGETLFRIGCSGFNIFNFGRQENQQESHYRHWQLW